MTSTYFRLSPAFFPAYVLDQYRLWLPYTKFRDIHRILRVSLSQNHVTGARYDVQWDSIATLLAKHISGNTKLSERLLEYIPEKHRFRYQPVKQGSKADDYRKALVDFAKTVAKDTEVSRFSLGEKGLYLSALWPNFETSDGDSIALLESKLFAMFSVLEWIYHHFFDTTVFYTFFYKRYEEWMHPQLLQLLRFYSVIQY